MGPLLPSHRWLSQSSESPLHTSPRHKPHLVGVEGTQAGVSS